MAEVVIVENSAAAGALVAAEHRVVPPLQIASLGADAGMIGAADLARVGR